MKQLIHKRHHGHLRKRALLELVGFIILIGFVLSQHVIIRDSLATVLEVEVLWFVLLLTCYWFLLPLTAICYKYISPKPKKINILTTSLAHLAGAGPGRIIPGGIGNMSISSVHLQKTGLTIEQAIGVVVTNNVFGVIANIILLVFVLIIRPDTLMLLTDSISSSQLLFVVIFLTFVVVAVQWLLHARSTQKEVSKTVRQWKVIAKQFICHPRRVFFVILIGMIIALIHTFMLDLSAFALGADLSFLDALIAFSFGVIIGSIIPTPGGLGGVEAGIAGALIILGYNAAIATSIAVLFRIATYWQPLIPGTLSYYYLRERKLL